MTGIRVLITGGADGIGFGIARRFVAAGAKVHVCDVRSEVIEPALQSLSLAGASQADVGLPEDVERLFRDASASLGGGIDVLINNVGIAGPQAFVEDLDYDDWDRTMRVNCGGMFYCIKQAVPLMKAQAFGVIINVSSVGTFTLPPKRSVYNASKWAVEGLTKSLARELGPFNIRCNAILPGIMNNDRMNRIIQRRADAEERTPGDITAEYLRYVAMGAMIDVDEIGEMAVFLASDKARHVTSQLISVCGGIDYEL
jgi:NAD(P)-dependent dehydrogenase (short-subunit alcohol dehydrogenase family)